MITKKVVLSQTKDLLPEDSSTKFVSNLEIFAEYKLREAELKAAEDKAKAARIAVMSVLTSIMQDLKETNDFTVTIEAENKSFLITSKSSKQTYLSEEDLQNKIEKLTEDLEVLHQQSQQVKDGETFVKTPSRITFNIKTI